MSRKNAIILVICLLLGVGAALATTHDNSSTSTATLTSLKPGGTGTLPLGTKDGKGHSTNIGKAGNSGKGSGQNNRSSGGKGSKPGNGQSSGGAGSQGGSIPANNSTSTSSTVGSSTSSQITSSPSQTSTTPSSTTPVVTTTSGGTKTTTTSSTHTNQVTTNSHPVTPPVADFQAPADPVILSGNQVGNNSATINWKDAGSPGDVQAYGIYRSGRRIAQVPETHYTISGLSCGTTYTISVDATDQAGNRSGKDTITLPMRACSAVTGNIFVSPSGSDSSCNRSNESKEAPVNPSDACASIKAAYLLADPGDEVVLLPGNYSDPQSIPFDSSKTEDVVTISPSGDRPVTLSGGLSFDGAAHVILNGQSRMTIHSLSALPSSNHKPSYLVINNLKIDGLADLLTVNHTTLQNINFLSSPGDALHLSGSNITVANAYFNGVGGNCIQASGGANITIENSHFYGCRGEEIKTSSSGHFSDWVIENNMFADCGSISLSGAAYWSGSARILYNSFSCAQVNLLAQDSFDKSFHLFLTGNAGGLTSCPSFARASVSYSHNLFPNTCGATDISGDPRFVSASSSNPNLHITSGSPAIDAGDPARYPRGDIDNQSRPCGQDPDIGADERC
jgi:hypothetical protein